MIRKVIGLLEGERVVINKTADGLETVTGQQHPLRVAGVQCKYGVGLTPVVYRAIQRPPHFRHIVSCLGCGETVKPGGGPLSAWHQLEQYRWKAAGAELEVQRGHHRADIVFNGTVVEAQRSYLSLHACRSRQNTYGPGMLWIFRIPERVKLYPTKHDSILLLLYAKAVPPIALQAAEGSGVFISHERTGGYYRVVGMLGRRVYVEACDPLQFAQEGAVRAIPEWSDPGYVAARGAFTERPRQAGLSDAQLRAIYGHAYVAAMEVAQRQLGFDFDAVETAPV